MVDRLAQGGLTASFASKFDGLIAEAEIDFHRVLLLKPETFMNLSGRCVGQVMRFYQIGLADLLVVCDYLNLPLHRQAYNCVLTDPPDDARKQYTAQKPPKYYWIYSADGSLRPGDGGP